MVKKTTELRREVKEEIKELTEKEYKEVKDIFGFSITTVNYNHDHKKTFKWKKSGNKILKWFYENDYSKKEAFNFIQEVNKLCDKYNVIKGSGVKIDYWNKDNETK